METTASNEDYLEAILVLEKDGSSKSVDISKFLGVSKPAVSIAMNDLSKKGLISKKSYGDISLTEEGRAVAEKILNRHNLLKKVLMHIGVEDEIAEEECCKVEHILSDKTIECLKKVCKKYNI